MLQENTRSDWCEACIATSSVAPVDSVQNKLSEAFSITEHHTVLQVIT